MDNSLENLSSILEALIKGARGTKEPPAPVSRGESGISDAIKKHVRSVIDDPTIKEKLQGIVSDKKFKEELKDSSKSHSEALKSLSTIVDNKNEVEKKLQERFDTINQNIENLFKLEQDKEKQASIKEDDTQKSLESILKKQEAPKSILEEREKTQNVNVVDFSELALEKLSKMFAVNVKQMSKDGKQTKASPEEEGGGGGLLDMFGSLFAKKGKGSRGGANAKGGTTKGSKTRSKNTPKSSTAKASSEGKPNKPVAEKPPKPPKAPKGTSIKTPRGTTKAAGKGIAKSLGKLAGPAAAVALGGLEYAERKSEGQTTTQALGGAAGSAAGGAAGGWGGAAAGAALGTLIFPGVGTVVGGVLGGIAGGLGGSWLGGKAADKLTGVDKSVAPEPTKAPSVENKLSVPTSPLEIKKEEQKFDNQYPASVPSLTLKPSVEKEQTTDGQQTQGLKVGSLYVENAVINRLREETKEINKKSDVSVTPKVEVVTKEISEQRIESAEKLSSKPNLISLEPSLKTEKVGSAESQNELSSDVIKELRKKTWEGKEKPEPVTPSRLIGPETQKDTETIKLENDKKVSFELQKLNDKTDDSNKLLLAVVQSVNALSQIMSDPETNSGRGNNIVFNNSQSEKDPELTAIEIAKAGDSSISNWRNEASYFRSNPV